jgi:carbonic anhydrase
MMNAASALERLRAGNRRFVRHLQKDPTTPTARATLAAGQAPSAIVLTCADSRVPPELVFDHGLGELFVVRVAGNVCAPSTLASIEYAASALGAELVVVMGHTQCGAVKATIESVRKGKHPGSVSLDDMVQRIAPAVRPVANRGLASNELLKVATRANALLAADRLRRESPVLRERIETGKLTVVSAEYALETGEVSFFDMICAESHFHAAA